MGYAQGVCSWFWSQEYIWVENITTTITLIVLSPLFLGLQMSSVVGLPGEWSTPSNLVGFESTLGWWIFQSIGKVVDDKVIMRESIPSGVWTGYSLGDDMASIFFLDTQIVLILADVQSSDYLVTMGILSS